jgi:hypothetical protein
MRFSPMVNRSTDIAASGEMSSWFCLQDIANLAHCVQGFLGERPVDFLPEVANIT